MLEMEPLRLSKDNVDNVKAIFIIPFQLMVNVTMSIIARKVMEG